MTHMMLNDDVQTAVEAMRMDAARFRERDQPAYYRQLKLLREQFEEDSVDDLVNVVAMLTVLIDEINAGEIE